MDKMERLNLTNPNEQRVVNTKSIYHHPSESHRVEKRIVIKGGKLQIVSHRHSKNESQTSRATLRQAG